MPPSDTRHDDPGRIYALARQRAQALRRQAIDAFWREVAKALRRRVQALRTAARARHAQPRTQGA